jgi:hypothetical protein
VVVSTQVPSVSSEIGRALDDLDAPQREKQEVLAGHRR